MVTRGADSFASPVSESKPLSSRSPGSDVAYRYSSTVFCERCRSALPNGRKVVTRPMNWMVCNSLPNLNSRTSPKARLSDVVRASACRLCSPKSGAGKFHMLTANEGSDPSSILCRKDARRTEDGELLPYPTLPRRPIVSEEKMDFSIEKPVLISDALPNPSAGDPARNDRVPLISRSPLADSTPPSEGGSTNRRIGRLDTERSTHFQSSSSAGPLAGAI